MDDSKLFNKQAEETEKITKKRSNKMKVVLGGILLCIVGVLVIIFWENEKGIFELKNFILVQFAFFNNKCVHPSYCSKNKFKFNRLLLYNNTQMAYIVPR